MKNLLFGLLVLCIGNTGLAQEKTYQLSTHILDISQGTPTGNVQVKLEKLKSDGKTWEFIAEKMTEENGRISDFLPSQNENNGIYRFTFFTKTYFENNHIESFYPFVQVVFEISDNKHYHVPITLSAYGYSTYRGS